MVVPSVLFLETATGVLILYFRILFAHGLSVDKLEMRAAARATPQHVLKITVEMSLPSLKFSAIRTVAQFGNSFGQYNKRVCNGGSKEEHAYFVDAGPTL